MNQYGSVFCLSRRLFRYLIVLSLSMLVLFGCGGGSGRIDYPPISVNPTSGLVTTEAGGTATFTVVLTIQPSSNVTIGVSSSDTTEGLVSGGNSPGAPVPSLTLTFTPSDWSTPQTVTVTGQDDSIVDGNQAFTIVTAAAISADSDGYSGLNSADISVTNNDNDTVTVTVKVGVVDTGQTTSYTTTFGEDSDYTINPPSYTDNGNGTVTDNVTGLMWQQEDDNRTYNWYEASGTSDAAYNPGGAVDVCGSLTLGSYSDWRLPDIQELTDILNLEVYAPAIDIVKFPNTNSSDYWSSTTRTTRAAAWYVDFSFGYVIYNNKSNNNYVRCVRGG